MFIFLRLYNHTNVERTCSIDSDKIIATSYDNSGCAEFYMEGRDQPIILEIPYSEYQKVLLELKKR